MSRVHSATPVDNRGIVRCYAHALKASRKTCQTQTSPNYGRQFYCCPLSDTNNPQQCAFFHWADDPMFDCLKSKSRRTSPSRPSEPHPTVHRGTTPPATPKKRTFQPSTTPSPDLTPSQKRTKIIQEALAGTSTASKSSQPKEPGSSPARFRSQKRLKDIQLALSPSRNATKNPPDVKIEVEPSTLFRSEHPSGITSHQQPSGSSSKNTNTLSTGTASRSHSVQGNDDDDEALWTLLTPPSSSQDLGSLSGEHCINPGTVPHASEDEKPDDILPEAGPSNWRSDDLDNPFDEHGSQSFPHSQVTNSTSQSNPYHCTSSESSAEKSVLSADTISALILSLDDIPEYVRKLERKKIAAEKSNDAKAKRINELEEEVERLQAANWELKKTVKALESRRF